MNKNCTVLVGIVLFLSLMLSVATGCTPVDDKPFFPSPEVKRADIYVSPSGSNDNSGLTTSLAVATLEKAVQIAVDPDFLNNFTNSKVVIGMMGGNYAPISLTNIDSPIPIEVVPYNKEQVSVLGGLTLNGSDFKPVSGDLASRLSTSNKQNVYGIDLSHLSDIDLGTMYAVGKYSSDKNYNLPNYNNRVIQAELYIDGAKQDYARYPNIGDDPSMLSIGNIINAGKLTVGQASPGGKFYIDSVTNARISTWRSLNDVWMYGYFGNDWADNSTKIKDYNATTAVIETTYAHNYSYKKDHKFNFYNVYEELDVDGEFYIDRDNKQLYIYSSTAPSQRNISLSTGNTSMLTMTNCKNITIIGLTFGNTRKNGITLTNCDSVTIKNCTIKELSGTAIVMSGKNLLIDNNDIFSIGAIGVDLNNAINTPLLVRENNVISNNRINNFGQITRTYAPAIDISGVGNFARNNLIHSSPHTAIMFAGNYNIIEQNEIYDVCLNVNDGGAIYAGRSFSYYGNEIRYNYLHDIGAMGIYLDDYLSGQRVFANVMANTVGAGLLVGGGRDNYIANNIFLNSSMSFDHRAYSYYNQNKIDYTDVVNGSFWKLVNTAKRLNKAWGNPFTSIADISDNVAQLGTAAFGVNPGGNTIVDNYFLSNSSKYMVIQSMVTKYSNISNNKTSKTATYNYSFSKSYDLVYMQELLDRIVADNSNLIPFKIGTSHNN